MVINILLGLLSEIYFMFIEMAPYLFLGLIFVGILHIYISKQFVASQLGKANIWSVIKASVLGVPLPLCSCGVIPTAVFMHKNGARKGSVVSFLISTPQTGVDSIIATYGMLGPIFAIFRPFAAFLMGILGGGIIHFFEKRGALKDQIAIDDVSDATCDAPLAISQSAFWNKINKFGRYAFKEFLDDISIQFGIGIVIAGIITFALPDDIASIFGTSSNLIAMLAVILIGVPMYICATASIPIALALIMKGFSPGVAFVFLAVGPATNAATIAILQKVLGKKMTIFYLLVLVILSLLAGFALDAIYTAYEFPLPTEMHRHSSHLLITPTVKYILSAVFLILLLMSYYRKIKGKAKMKQSEDTTVIHVSGMTCNHCVANVKSAAEKIQGVEGVDVNLDSGKVSIEGDFDIEKVKKAIEATGYDVD